MRRLRLFHIPNTGLVFYGLAALALLAGGWDPASAADTDPKKAPPAKKSAATPAKKAPATNNKTASKTTANKTAANKSTANKQSANKQTTAPATRKATYVRRYRVPYFSAEDREAAMTWIQENMTPQQETFENVRALVPFFEQLYQASRTKSAVHILHYGDSHTASDDFPNTLRETFQARFGNGGPGFVLAGRPFPGYRRYDMPDAHSTANWLTEGILQRRGDGMQGLGGVSITSSRAGNTVAMTAAGEESELLFLQQPEGGAIEVWVDDNLIGTINTQGDLRPATTPLVETPGEHRYLFKTLNANPVRLFGTVVQNKSGVTWESFGINGAQATILSDWDESILATHMAKRKPALIVLAYGTNEAVNPKFDPKDYAAALRTVLWRVRRAAPLASILLVGPPDCKLAHPQNLDLVTDVQIAVAHEVGAAFWHWRDHMGGAGSVQFWLAAGLGQYDQIHLTPAGYQLVGRTLAEELLIQYQRFVNARMETEE